MRFVYIESFFMLKSSFIFLNTYMTEILNNYSINILYIFIVLVFLKIPYNLHRQSNIFSSIKSSIKFLKMKIKNN